MVDAVVLLGWMKAEVAVAFLREGCVFAEALSEASAHDLWARHRQRIERLKGRTIPPPDNLPLSAEEELSVSRFLVEQSRPGGRIVKVVKVDPFELAVRQLGVTIDRCDHFARSALSRSQWIAQWLCPEPTPLEGRVRASINAVNVEVPHGEFVLRFDPQLGFQVVEAPRYVAVRSQQDSMTLIAGYHRVYAYLASRDSEADRSLLAAVAPDLASDVDAVGVAFDGADDAFAIAAPVFGDFFDDRLALRVKMRPRRFELQVRARMAVIPS